MIDERTLPQYLKTALEGFKNADKMIKPEWWCEVYGAINSAQHGFEITPEVAAYLRDKYLGI